MTTVVWGIIRSIAELDTQGFIFVRPWHPKWTGEASRISVKVLTHNTEGLRRQGFRLCPSRLFVHSQPLWSVRFSKAREPRHLSARWLEALGPKPIPSCSVCPEPQTAAMSLWPQPLWALSPIMVETPGSAAVELWLSHITLPGEEWHSATPAPLHIQLLSRVLVSARYSRPCMVFLDSVCLWKVP